MSAASVKKKKQQQQPKVKKARVDPNIECVYETEVTFTCPTRGTVTQKVKVKRYKTKCTDVPHKLGKETGSELLNKLAEEEGVSGLASTEESANDES